MANQIGTISVIEGTVVATATGTAANALLQGLNDGSSTNLLGDASQDVLFASIGQDTLTSGSGYDSFVWTKENIDGVGAQADLIVYFSVDDSVLDLSDLLSDGSHTITGTNISSDLRVEITKDCSDVVQLIDLQGVLAGIDSTVTLKNLLADGSIYNGIELLA